MSVSQGRVQRSTNVLFLDLARNIAVFVICTAKKTHFALTKPATPTWLLQETMSVITVKSPTYLRLGLNERGFPMSKCMNSDWNK